MKEIEVVTEPLTNTDKKLQEKFVEDIANQSLLMDSIGKQLITLELAIPGGYATALKLFSVKNINLKSDIFLYITFGLWFVSLILTFFAIFPKKYAVDTDNLNEIEEYFLKSAKHKRFYLIISSITFFTGIVVSLFTIF